MKRWVKGAVFASLAAILINLGGLPAGAGLTDIDVTGTVTDMAGTSVSGVRISDGDKAVWTNANGNFVIKEPLGAGFTLSATRVGLISSSKSGTAWPGTVVTFKLYYALSVALSPNAFNNSPPKTLQLAAKSYAPPESCLVWTDAATGAQVTLALQQAVLAGESTWTGSFPVAADRSDGSYTWRMVGDTCSGTAVTKVASGQFIVDSWAPMLLLEGLAPPADGNTTLANQPLVVTVQDLGSGADASTVQLTIRTRSGDQLPTPSKSLRWLNSTTLVVTSSPVALTEAGLYTASVSVSDRAGNLLSYSWNFRRITVSVSQANAEIEPSIGKLVSSSVGFNDWSFLPRLRIGQFQVSSGLTEHSGFGPIGQIVDVSSARIEFDLGPTHLVSDVRPFPQGATATVYKQFLKLKDEGADTKTLYGQTVYLEPVTVKLSQGAENPLLIMDPVRSTPYVPASDCPTPDSLVPSCTPDPLRFFVPEDFATRIDSVKDNIDATRVDETVNPPSPPTPPGPQPASSHLTESPMFLIRLVPEAVESSLPTQAHWVLVTLDNTTVYTGYDEQVLGFVGGVAYQYNIAPLAPVQFPEACEKGYPCVSVAAAAANPSCPDPKYPNGASCNPGRQAGCVMIDGYDRRRGDDRCNQLVGVVDFQAPFRQGSQRLRAGFALQVGSADAVSVYTGDPYGPISDPFDEWGFAWNSYDGSTGNWGWYGDIDSNPNNYNSFSTVRYDYYYCDGDEIHFFDNNNTKPHYHWYEAAEARYDVAASLDPRFGFAQNLANRVDPDGGWPQYYETKSDGLYTNDCAGYYDQDDKALPGFRRWHRRYPLGRGWNIYMDSQWDNSRAGDKGEATLTWGHIWTRFSYRFRVHFGPGIGCGPGSRGPSCAPDFIGFSVEPDEQRYEDQAFYKVSWCYNMAGNLSGGQIC